ncbi:MAG: alkaline phosphatase family protein [bacterium]|nr:alkaline phosphatase family protein [bacterium]
MASWIRFGRAMARGRFRSVRRPIFLLGSLVLFVLLADASGSPGPIVSPAYAQAVLLSPPNALLAARSPASREPSVVLISLDGTRPVDVRPDRLPSLVELARRGARAEGLIPVDPSNTFPSHVSMATGVRPEVHRLVNNVFIDPERGRFKRDAPHTWVESEPIWSIAERHGVKTAAYFWVGSEGPWRDGPGPSETRRFSSRTVEKVKVDRILDWLLVADPKKRPRLITSWFHGADHASHLFGPDSPEVTEFLAPQDRQIARLVREMEAHGLFETTTLIFVSDHGMVEAPRRLNLQKALRAARLRLSVLGIGGFATVVFDGGEKTPDALGEAIAIARAGGLEAWAREAAPSDWRVDDPRFGDIVVRAPIGLAIVGATTRIDGFHGYDAREPSMAGLLVARGRGVESGSKLGRVSGLAIAPTILSLLGLPIPAQMKEEPIRGLLAGIERAATVEGATQ